MINTLMVFSVLLYFFGVDLIILLARLLVCICCEDLFSSLETLFLSLFSQILLSFWRDSSLSAWVLLGFWGNLFEFVFSSLEVLLLSDSFYLSGIYTLLNVGFFSNSERVVVALEMMSSKILRSLIQITLFWSSM